MRVHAADNNVGTRSVNSFLNQTQVSSAAS
jgi:hypothetical protein